MKLTHEHARRQKRTMSRDMVRPEVEPDLPTIPAREKLLKEWPSLKDQLLNWPSWRYEEDNPDRANDPGPFEYYMDLLLIVAAAAPEKIPEIRAAVGERAWNQLKDFLEQTAEAFKTQGVTRTDMWIKHVVGARILFPEHAEEIVQLFRPHMQPMLNRPYYIQDSDIGPYLVQTYLADPEFPDLKDLIQQKLPVLRKRLLEQLKNTEHAPGIVHNSVFLFLLSPEDRQMYQEAVMKYLEVHKDRIDLDLRSGKSERRFAGYFIKEPWYSCVLVPSAHLADGKITFELEKPLASAATLPERLQT